MGFGLADSIYADRVIVVTDNLVPFPAIPHQIYGNNVDYVVEVDVDRRSHARSSRARPRSPRVRTDSSPPSTVARFMRDAGIMRDGFSFQAGAGGIALAFAGYLKEMMKEAGVKARFVRGGSIPSTWSTCSTRATPTTSSTARPSIWPA